VDAGLSGIEIERRLEAVGVSPQSLDAIFVTHEHTDHIKGVGVLARRYKLPVYANSETLLNAEKALGKTSRGRFHSNRRYPKDQKPLR
jgi:phosphoribosyl 1,2-cyclic phosphodiesterase